MTPNLLHGSAKTDFTLSQILAWARTKPAEEAYEYTANENCALCQFIRETGRADHPSVGAHYWNEWEGVTYGRLIARHTFPDGLANTLQARSFGELVSRLEKLVPPETHWLCPETYLSADVGEMVS